MRQLCLPCSMVPFFESSFLAFLFGTFWKGENSTIAGNSLPEMIKQLYQDIWLTKISTNLTVYLGFAMLKCLPASSCGQQQPRSACPSAQSDQGLHCLLIFGCYRMFERRAKAWMILCTHAGWSESVHFVHVRRHHFTWCGPFRITAFTLHTTKTLYNTTAAGLRGSVGYSSDWWSGGCGFNPCRVRQHSFVEIDHEIFSMLILSLLLIQEEYLSVSGKRLHTNTG